MPDRHPELLCCTLCPHNCGVNRYEKTGFCGASADIVVNLAQLHQGEEPVLSGSVGSGTIFFSHCNLKCVFCQNYRISAQGMGTKTDADTLIDTMLSLQDRGAHNINLVTPTHYSVPLAGILSEARKSGLSIPIVWNSNGYEKVEVLKMLDGIVNIYLPDFKYGYGIYAKKYSHAFDYPSVAKTAINEMYRQVGKLMVKDGLAVQGLIIRLLVLPNRISQTSEILHWILDNLGNEIYISLMAQYYPTHQAPKYPEINRGITAGEYAEVTETLSHLGFQHGYMQELSCSADWTPKFHDSNDIEKERTSHL